MRIKAFAHTLRTAGVWMILSVPAIGLQTSVMQVSGPQMAASAYNSHDIAGDWQGTLEFPVPGHPNAKYRLVLRIAKAPHGGWTALPPLLVELWREQHPDGHEQTYIDFNVRKPPAQMVPLNFENAKKD